MHKKKGYTSQRIKIGKSFFVPILMKVVATNPDGSPRWLEVARDDETMDIEHGSREFYLVWGSEMLAGRAKQNGAVAMTAPKGAATGPLRIEDEPAITTDAMPADALNDRRQFAVWLNSRGWLVAAERDASGLVRVTDRLQGAARFATEDEAQAALEAVDRLDGGVEEYLSGTGSVVTL